MDEGVAVHVKGGEVLANQVYNPVTHLVVASGEESILPKVEGVRDG